MSSTRGVKQTAITPPRKVWRLVKAHRDEVYEPVGGGAVSFRVVGIAQAPVKPLDCIVWGPEVQLAALRQYHHLQPTWTGFPYISDALYNTFFCFLYC